MTRAVVRFSALDRQAKMVPITSRPMNQNHRFRSHASSVAGAAMPSDRDADVSSVWTHVGSVSIGAAPAAAGPSARSSSVPAPMMTRIAAMDQPASAPRRLSELSKRARRERTRGGRIRGVLAARGAAVGASGRLASGPGPVRAAGC